MTSRALELDDGRNVVFHTQKTFSDGNAVKRSGQWVKWTYQQYHDDVIRAAESFIKLGVAPFKSVGIIGFNAPEWHIGFYGSVYAGALPMGMYTTSSPDAIQYMASHSEANVILVEDELQLEKILQVWNYLPQLKAVVQYTGTVSKKKPNIYTWSEFMNLSVAVPNSKIQERLDLQKPNICCSVIYTSGTTGRPKGVMISHDNYTWGILTVVDTLESANNEDYLSYLPLCHIAAQIFDILGSMASKGVCYFAQPDALKGCLFETLKEVKPTIFLCVPRIWEKMAEALCPTNKPCKTPFDARHFIGLERGSLLASGAAPIARSTLELLRKFEIPVIEGYGMSETTGLHSRCSADDPKSITSVGREYPGIRAKIIHPDADGNGEEVAPVAFTCHKTEVDPVTMQPQDALTTEARD